MRTIASFSAPLLLLTILLLSSVTQAQSSRFITGKIAYENQDYPKAWEALNDALENPALLKDKQVVDARLTRIETAYRLHLRPDIRPSGLTDKQLADIAWADWEKVEHADAHAHRLSSASSGAFNLGVQVAMADYAAGNYTEVAQRLGPMQSLAIEKADILQVLGQSRQNIGDIPGAQTAYQQALSAYKATPPDDPNPMHGYVYYQLAYMTRHQISAYQDPAGRPTSAGIEAALSLVDQGLVWAGKESKRSSVMGFDQIIKDLTTMRLDCLINLPERQEEALEALDAAVAAEPEKLTLRIAYAQALEKNGRLEDAKAAYQAALDRDPDQMLAWFNLGALHINEAAALYQEANAAEDSDEADGFMDQANILYGKARIPMENVLRLEPGNREAIRILMDISLRNGDEEAYMKYKAMQDQ